MLRIPTKQFSSHEIAYYSYINYNYTNGYLLEEDRILDSIDASLPTGKELVKQRKRYNSISKKMDSYIRKQKAKKILNPHFLYEHQISVFEDNEDIYVIDRDGSTIKWDRDTYEHFKTEKGFKFKHVPKF